MKALLDNAMKVLGLQLLITLGLATGAYFSHVKAKNFQDRLAEFGEANAHLHLADIDYQLHSDLVCGFLFWNFLSIAWILIPFLILLHSPDSTETGSQASTGSEIHTDTTESETPTSRKAKKVIYRLAETPRGKRWER